MRVGTLLVVPLLLATGLQPVARPATVPVTVVGQVVDAACYMMHPRQLPVPHMTSADVPVP